MNIITKPKLGLLLLALFLIASCHTETIKFEPVGTVSEAKGFDGGLPSVKAYNVSYNPNANAIVTIYLQGVDQPDTFQTKPFNNPGQLAAMLTLFNSDSTITFDKEHNEFHYTHYNSSNAKGF
jgi:hypothetical protein